MHRYREDLKITLDLLINILNNNYGEWSKVEKLVLIGVGPLSVTSEIILKY